MTDDLRTRITKALSPYRYGHSFTSPEAVDYARVDAVIGALGSDCIYRYVCANCGDFWFDKSERMQRFALLHSRSHLAVIQETKQCEKAGGGFSQWHRYVTEWEPSD